MRALRVLASLSLMWLSCGLAFAQTVSTAVPPAEPSASTSTPAAAMTVNITKLDVISAVLYVLILGWLSWIAYRKSKTAEEYLVAGRDTHPFVMALSYGATFISTSAIVGFGGVAGSHGMSLLWLTFLNIFTGIFVAFAVLGAPIRRMGQHLKAHTFPELLGKRYDSKFVQVFAGALIFIFMPIYVAAVMLGGVKFLFIQFNINYAAGILIFGVIVAFYVIVGGLRGVMYTDAFQGLLMFVGMVVLLFYAYAAAGGFISAHQALGDLSDHISKDLRYGGIAGYTQMPMTGSPKWWWLVSSLVLGVGIGVLAQPQLAVRFMTVKSRKEINRACAIGGVFILAMTGTAFVVGALSNVYFHAKFNGKTAIDVALDRVTNKTDTELIIPTFIKQAMPAWFSTFFFLTLLSAAMSTLSSQFHTMGAAIGRDVYERLFRRGEAKADVWTRFITQVGIAVAVIVSLLLSWKYSEKPNAAVIARATSIFFALCASTFLPSLILGLFWRRMNRKAAIASMLVAFLFTAFWLTFMQKDTATALGVTTSMFGMDTAKSPPVPVRLTLVGRQPWPFIDALVFALPLSFIVAVAVALITKPMSEEHLNRCFPKTG